MQINVIVFSVTLLSGVALIVTQHKHGHWSLDTAFGVQNHHTSPTPRIGGVAVMVGLLAAWWLAVPDVHAILSPMLLASVPAFTFGLAEDVLKRVGVMPRLLATMSSGLLAWYLTGVAMQNAGLPPLDWALGFLPLAVLFTMFAVGGVANSINIIDGFNGLASGAVAIMLAALGIIAGNVGDAALATTCFTLAVCSLGFCAVNWPSGRIFLGDGGAYLLGFLLAWVAVLLPMRNPQVNAWTSFLVCAYPVLEVLFSVLRRRRREGHHPGQPDKVHLHHLIHRRVVCQVFPRLSSTIKNGLTSPICWFLVAVPALLSIAFAKNTFVLAFCFGCFCTAYFFIYARLSQFRWCATRVRASIN